MQRWDRMGLCHPIPARSKEQEPSYQFPEDQQGGYLDGEGGGGDGEGDGGGDGDGGSGDGEGGGSGDGEGDGWHAQQS